MKRSYQALLAEKAVVKAQKRALQDEIEACPEEQERVDAMAANVRAEMRAEEARVFAAVVPAHIRAAFPKLRNIELESCEFPMTRLQHADALKVWFNYDGEDDAAGFRGIIFHEARETVPWGVITHPDDEDVAAFRADPWAWALDSNMESPERALFALLAHGYFKLSELPADDDLSESILKQLLAHVPAALPVGEELATGGVERK